MNMFLLTRKNTCQRRLSELFYNFTSNSTPDEVVIVPQVGDCDGVDHYPRLSEIPL
jgi:hypothetical protein